MSKKNLIIFIVPDKKVVNGGVIAIFNHATAARRFFDIHHSETVISTYPGHDTYNKNDLFKNDERVYSFDEIMKLWDKPGKLLIHIPETAIHVVSKALNQKKYWDYIKSADGLHINVMTQNIDLLRPTIEFAELFRMTPFVTQTTAHDGYTTQKLSNKYQTPVHLWSVYTDISQFKPKGYEKKENLIAYSPDDSPHKEEVLKVLAKSKKYKLKEIKGLTYEQFEELTSRSKFTLTFGEGFDGYFIRGFFLGSVGLSVYNDRFFPDKSFLKLRTVFRSYAEIKDNILSVLEDLDDRGVYEKYVEETQKKLSKIYSYDRYLKNVENFYRQKYDYCPERDNSLLIDVLNDRYENLKEIDKLHGDNRALYDENLKLHERLKNILGSKSWKLTKPLRKINRGTKARH